MEEDILHLQQGKTIRFAKLVRICTKWFGEPRVKGSHHVFKTPWKGDPRVNLQKAGMDAKPYQVKQVIAALERLSGGNEDEL